jgi:hypothetical protein
MTIDSLQFPCLCIHKGTMFTVASADSVATTTAAALRGGLFERLNIIDSAGKEFLVKSARKLHGVGRFWGFNIFLTQRIRVALEIESTGRTYTADEVRQIVTRDFRSWHGWASREDFDQLKESVLRATSSAEILHLVTSNRP